MQIEKNDGVEECEVIEFSLKANNGLADSPAGTVIGGFPIGEQGTPQLIVNWVIVVGQCVCRFVFCILSLQLIRMP